MEAIVLKSDLREILEKDAAQESRTLSDIVNEAVEHYLHERQIAKLEAEIEAYHRMHPQLKQKFLGEWVAVHDRQLVDHDVDRAEMYRRVRARYGRTTVLLRQV